MDLKKLRWYYDRLNKMSMNEVFWRIDQKRKTNKYTNKYIKDKYLITSLDLYDITYKTCLDNFDISFLKLGQNHEYVETLPNSIFENFKVVYKGKYSTPNWHETYHKVKTWPLEFSTKLNIKQRDDIGDPRVAWEINRLHYFPSIALKYAVTKDESYLELLENHFYDWVDNNPFFWGVNWTSPMEAAIRNISFLFTVYYLSKSVENETVKSLMKDIQVVILNQNEYINDFYSQHSSANNHLIVEMVAMNLVAICFGVDSLQKKTQTILEKEIIRQTFEDGVNKEQAIHYHAFVLETLLIWMKFCEDRQIEISSEVTKLIQRMVEYIADMMDEKGNVPALGDSDEGKLLSLSEENHFVMVLDLATLLFNIQYSPFKEITSPTVSAINWNYQNKFDNYNLQEVKIYPHGGKYIYRKRINNKNIFLTFEFGNLGMEPLYAHGHADALSIILHVDGIPIFIDPGTYIYNINYPLRDKLRNPLSHNTLVIENDNFSNSKGAFIWDKTYSISHNYKTNNIIDSTLTTLNNNVVKRRVSIDKEIIKLSDYYTSHFNVNLIINPQISIIKKSDKRLVLSFENKEICSLVFSNSVGIFQTECSLVFTNITMTSKLIVKAKGNNEIQIRL